MNKEKNENRKFEQNELELGRYLESDMLSVADDEDVVGGISPTFTVALSAVTAFVSTNTCPTTACTRAC